MNTLHEEQLKIAQNGITIKNNVAAFQRSFFSNWYGAFKNQPWGAFNMKPGDFTRFIQPYSQSNVDRYYELYDNGDILTNNNISFNCSEQAMMFGKAVIFGDWEKAEEIMRSSHPNIQKTLGRAIKGYNPVYWANIRVDYMTKVLFEKFKQNPVIDELLTIKYKNYIICEASPWDAIWGIGMGPDNPDTYDVDKWQGLNVLGTVLMNTRMLRQNHMNATTEEAR